LQAPDAVVVLFPRMFYSADLSQSSVNFSDFSNGVLQALLLNVIVSGAAAKHR